MSATPLNPVIIPILRRVMPTLIANSIVGVAPMTAPSAQLSKLRKKFRIRWEGAFRPVRYRVAPEVYRYFLRINNRRRTQSSEDLDVAGYHAVSGIPWTSWEPADEWCTTQLEPHSWLRFPGEARWWFSRESDAVLFGLVWA